MTAGRAVAARPVGIAAVDLVLGGGVYPRTVQLLSGTRGGGLTTLALQMAGGFTRHRPALFATGEMSAEAMASYVTRLGGACRHVSVIADPTGLAVNEVLDHARRVKAELLVVDSLRVCKSHGTKARFNSKRMMMLCIERFRDAVREAATDLSVLLLVPGCSGGALPVEPRAIHGVDALLVLERWQGSEGRILGVAGKSQHAPDYMMGAQVMTSRGLVDLSAP